jgi:hypothetical protein
MAERLLSMWPTLAGRRSRERFEHSLLISGFSVGEGVAVFALLAGVTLVAALQISPAIARVTAMEAISLSTHPKVDWMERWALGGDLPVRDGKVVTAAIAVSGIELEVLPPSRYYAQVPKSDTQDFAIYRRHGDQKSFGGDQLQILPAFGPGAVPQTMVWLCGRAPIPPGFTRAGVERTTVPNLALPSVCRARQ